MSDLQKAWAKRKLDVALPGDFEPVLEGQEMEFEVEELEDDQVPELPDHLDDGDSSSASSASSTGTVIPSPSQRLFARPQGGPERRRTWDPIPWTTYFERELFLPSDDASQPPITYHAYLTSPAPPSHSSSQGGPLFVTHHGAGSSGLSFALLASEIRRLLPHAGILSLDARGHGSTTVSPAAEQQLDLSLDTLTDDLRNVILLTQHHMSWDQLPPLVLVGHSLGGAVVTSLATNSHATLRPKILGHAVLDVVEGSAIDALQSMHSYLSTRPPAFASVQSAIEWHVRSRTLRNSLSARTSVPSLLVLQEDDQSQSTSSTTQPQPTLPPTAHDEAPAEIPAPNNTTNSKPTTTTTTTASSSRPWHWRTDLSATQPFWQGWFQGLSRKFLQPPGGKLLLLAGTDRLDTELTIGQMQGKYALQVFPEAGHFIHEDLPEKTAIALADFFRRNDRSALVLPPKVSDLLKQGKKV